MPWPTTWSRIPFSRRSGGGKGYDLRRPDARPWLYGIAANLIGKHRRAEVRMWRVFARTGIDPAVDGHAERPENDGQWMGAIITGLDSRGFIEESDSAVHCLASTAVEPRNKKAAEDYLKEHEKDSASLYGSVKLTV
jgi:hypothetical protein